MTSWFLPHADFSSTRLSGITSWCRTTLWAEGGLTWTTSCAQITGAHDRPHRRTPACFTVVTTSQDSDEGIPFSPLRTPEPGNHSFAGASTAFPSSEPARCSQTELLNLRDRVPGGGGNRGSRRGRGKGRDAGLLQGRLAERGPEETAALREQLCQVFPGQDNMVALVLQSHPAETDINVLSDLLLE